MGAAGLLRLSLLPPSFATDLLPFWFAFNDKRRFGVPLAPPLLARAPTGFFALTGLAGLGLVLKAVSCSTVEVMNFTLSLRFSSSRSCLSIPYSSNIASRGTPSYAKDMNLANQNTSFLSSLEVQMSASTCAVPVLILFSRTKLKSSNQLSSSQADIHFSTRWSSLFTSTSACLIRSCARAPRVVTSSTEAEMLQCLRSPNQEQRIDHEHYSQTRAPSAAYHSSLSEALGVGYGNHLRQIRLIDYRNLTTQTTSNLSTDLLDFCSRAGAIAASCSLIVPEDLSGCNKNTCIIIWDKKKKKKLTMSLTKLLSPREVVRLDCSALASDKPAQLSSCRHEDTLALFEEVACLVPRRSHQLHPKFPIEQKVFSHYTEGTTSNLPKMRTFSISGHHCYEIRRFSADKIRPNLLGGDYHD
ncbi:hypothetical protein HID58_051386 [Brassica napus]|uniref:Uncharacterized protein n=1 Tax=Brassica napus TaxID=3708 RepID=A0ABQ8A8T2_BRANA|nr:hypothetical protein HID58_051386 [Brassica napus]